jgi:acyl transferase domain-containing protein/acyl carrier protein
MTDTAGQVTTNNSSEIAIIGLTGRFPGAAGVEEFWRNLRDGVESVTFFTDEDLLAAGIDSSTLSNPNYVKAGRYLEGIDMFDASFFGFSPREAEILDPQQRIFLECSWEALENAGYDPKTYDGLIGVHAGVSANTYIWNIFANRELHRTVGNFQTIISNDKDFLATRVSYKLGLQGSSMTVQTSCSTSLVAVHLACQSLLNGESDMALAGGVSVTLPHKSGYWYREEGILSPDGHCRAFDENAQGTVSGMGVGIVVLKRLEDALADGDYIHAVIKGSAINNDGSVKVGYTAPSVEGQAQVIKMAQIVAAVEPETISYVEAHGTGTTLGDPIEVAALTKAFRAETEKKGFCAIGSVKTNIGHLDVAAGVAGLIKTVLALEHKQLPPSLNFEKANPRIDFENSPFFVNSKLTEWKNGNGPRRAGVSSFGIGGTNAHVILEEKPRRESFDSLRPWQLLLVSAKSSEALEAATARLVSHLQNHPELNLADVAYTLQVGRRAFAHRRMLVCRDVSDVIEASPSGHKRIEDGHQVAEKPPVVFMFPGQGTQYVGMAHELYQHEPFFRQHLDRCCELLRPQLKLDLRDLLYPSLENKSAAEEQLRQTSVTQPALFAIEYALAQLWMAWGVRPRAMIGHSIGEYVAACVSGVMSLEDALWLVARRGEMMQGLSGGAMLAVPLCETEIVEMMGEGLSLAAVNSPTLCVVSGDEDAVDELAQRLSARGVSWRRLHTSHAFHSAMMEPVLAEFAREVGKVKLNAPKIPYISNVTGTWIRDAEAIDPQYWATHLRQTVRFAAGLEELSKEPGGILLEVGPGKTLTMLAGSRAGRSSARVSLTSLRHADEKGSDEAYLMTTLGRLWLAGVQVNWQGFYANERRQRLPLPTYPFERQRYWVEPQGRSNAAAKQQGALDKKTDIGEWFYIPSWKRSAPLPSFESQLQSEEKNGWLIFEDDCGLGSQMTERLRREGQEVFTVRAGERFAKSGERAYLIDPQKSEDYRALLEDVSGHNCQLNKIVHLWNVTPEDCAPSEIELVNNSARACFYNLLFLGQAVGEQNLSVPLTLEVVSNSAQEVVGGDALRAEKATALGLCKVISQEYHRIDCRAIDIALPTSNSAQEQKLVELLLVEACAHSPEPVVAYRGGHRWVQVFEQIRLDEPRQETRRLREGGVYLITGGLGGLGLTFARYLAEQAHAKLVLVGRAELPAREEWTGWLSAHAAEDETSLKIREVLALEAKGAEVLIESADVTDIKRMREVLARARERFGRIDGVIHASGIAGGGLIELKEPHAADAVLAPKVLGTLVLDELLKETPLDFFILCSSLASLMGGIGQADYCAANSFMDAFAYQRNLKDGAFTVAVNWDTWQQVGMAARAALPPGLEEERRESLRQGILPQEGADVFGRILSGSTSARVIVSSKDLAPRIVQSRSVRAAHHLPETKSTPLSQPSHPRPQLAKAYLAPRDEVEQSIVEIWQELFGIDEIGVEDDFIELGGHSLLAMQLVSRIRESFQLEIPLRMLFESPTVAGLASSITQKRDSSKGASNTVARIQRDDDEQLLSRLDELSEDEVDALLGDMLAESEV